MAGGGAGLGVGAGTPGAGAGRGGGRGSAAADSTLWAAMHTPAMRDPRGWIIPFDQPDFSTATKFVDALLGRAQAVLKRSVDFCEAFFQTDPLWCERFDAIWSWMDWPGRQGRGGPLDGHGDPAVAPRG